VLTSDGGAVRAVLTDFGLAHRPDASLQSSRSPEVAGTPDYMAPELWKGAAVSVASDVYALGVILREMVCGQEPNARWNRVVKRCLCHDPAERYASVGEIAHALAPASRRLFLTSAVAAGLALASGIATYKTTTGPTETVRLALLPLESDAAGISRGLAGQFSRLKGSARTRWSLAPFTQSDGQYSDPIGHARTALSATHVLQGSITPEKDSFSVQAYLIDTRTRARTGEFKAVYRSGEERYIPVALAGMVTATFGLPPMEGAGEMDPAARQHFQSGLIQLRRESRVDNGIASMQRAVAADPHSALTHAGQALAWWWKYFVANDDKYLSLSEQSLAEAQRRNGDLALVHHVAGLHFLNKDMHGEAVKEFLRTVELDPENCDGHRALAIAYEGAGEDDKAVSEYQRAIELDPQYHRNYQAFATYYYHRSEHEEAIKHFKKAVELAPQEPATHYALATGYIEIGEFSAAEAELRTALVLGETPRFLNNLAVALMYQRRDQEAIPYLTRALDSSPHRYRWWMNLGIAYQRRGLLQESRRAYEQGLAEAQAELMKNPRNVANMARGGSAYLRARLGDLQGSQSDIAQALSYAPKDQGIRWMALLTYEASGRREDSLDLLKSGPYAVLADASRWPELSDLAQDPRFQSLLLSKQQSEVHK
jgi:Flp pilus assembly protein TadD